jgi:DNA-binding PadR family transcriptional regulator
MCAAHVVTGMAGLNPDDHLPLRPVEFEILLTLAGGERHGYAIIQETEARSHGSFRLETGTLYRALHRLGSVGLVKPTSRRPVSTDPDEERRRYYAITGLGRAVAAAEAARLARLVAAAKHARLLVDPA